MQVRQQPQSKLWWARRRYPLGGKRREVRTLLRPSREAARLDGEHLAAGGDYATALAVKQRLQAAAEIENPRPAGDAALARRLWPRLVKWYAWFTRTQAGEVRGSFRWRGRDRNDRKLNAMTLSSGLDDYPRASTPSKAERHVDLHCWITYFARFLALLPDFEQRCVEIARHARLGARTLAPCPPASIAADASSRWSVQGARPRERAP